MRSVDPTDLLIDRYLDSLGGAGDRSTASGATGGLEALMVPPSRRSTRSQLHPSVLESVRTRFGLPVDTVERAGRGVEADVWVAHIDGMSPMCVKRFRRSDRDLMMRLQLTEQLRAAGVPFPQAHLCVRGHLASTCARRWVAISEWVDGTILETFTTRAAATAGATLARLHTSLRLIADAERDWKATWEAPDAVPVALEICARLRRAIEQTRRPTLLDIAIYDALAERSQQLVLVDALRCDLPPMAPQVVHGDFTRPNLLFRGDELVAVLDLQGRTGYPMWEIGKLAFEPETLVWRPDGMQVAVHALSAYADEIGEGDQVVGAARTTILANLLSFWGISSRYATDGGLTPTGGEAYWLNRHTATRMLLAALSQVEAGVPPT